jgi:hypothetical protein
VGEEPAEEGEVGDNVGQEDGTVVARGIRGPAVVAEELKEGGLQVRRRREDVF